MGGIYLSKSDSKHKFVKDILVKKKRRLTSCSLPAEKGEIASKKKLKSTPPKRQAKNDNWKPLRLTRPPAGRGLG